VSLARSSRPAEPGSWLLKTTTVPAGASSSTSSGWAARTSVITSRGSFPDRFTFPGALRYAALAGHPVHAVGTDGEGIHPAALDRALAAHARASRARPLLSVTPVLHNPTTATMGGRRRREVVAVARRHDALIVEDDVYSPGQERIAPALAAFLPVPRRLADAVVLAAAAEGVALTDPASLMAAPDNPDSGIRVCLGGPSWAELTSGLATVRDVLSRCAKPSVGSFSLGIGNAPVRRIGSPA
jgi:DNA-binding transcriptional MocR family regulator